MWPKIDANTDLKEIQKIHKDIWNYVMEVGHKPETPYISDCVLYSYAALQYLFQKSESPYRTEVKRCDFCPAIWGSEKNIGIVCWEPGSSYCEWFPDYHLNYNRERSRKVAEEIRDIPFDFDKIENAESNTNNKENDHGGSKTK